MADLPHATQRLTPTGLVQRQAECPDHHKLTSEFIGVGQVDGAKQPTWRFRCSALTSKGAKADHIFAALVDRTAPTTPEEAVAWMATKRAERAGLQPTKSQS